MQTRKTARSLLAALALLFITAAGGAAAAQEAESPRPQGGVPARAEVNHEVHLHLLVTAEGAEGVKLPPSLDGVVRQLKAALPPAEYRLAATFINRVRDGGVLEVKTVGGGAFGHAQTPSLLPPAYLQLNLAGVKLIDPGSAQPSINIQHFRLGMKMPVQMAAGGSQSVLQYEDTGLNTTLSVREGVPTLVGTLNAGGPGRLFVIVVTVSRTNK